MAKNTIRIIWTRKSQISAIVAAKLSFFNVEKVHCRAEAIAAHLVQQFQIKSAHQESL